MKKRMFTFVFALLITASALSVGATSPPYSKQFDSEKEMLTSLSEYAAEFPDVEDYSNADLSQPQDGYHLEEKQIIIPKINDNSYYFEEFSYAESSWGSGVNCIFTSYSKHDGSNSLRFITYYHFNRETIADILDSAQNSSCDESVYEGNINDYCYIAYEDYDESGKFARCTYEIAADECLVVVYSTEPYDEEFLNNIVFDSTDILLPVYVQNKAESDDKLLGDANEDGSLNIKDATAIQKYKAKIIMLTERGLELADFDKDGKVNIKDATAIQKYIAKL